MRSTRPVVFCGLLAALCGFAAAGQAAQVTVDVRGTVTYVGDHPVWEGQVEVGDAYRYVVSYDSEAAPTAWYEDEDRRSCLYEISLVSLTVGNLELVATGESFAVLVSGPEGDYCCLTSSVATASGVRFDTSELRFYYPAGTFSEELPLLPPDAYGPWSWPPSLRIVPSDPGENWASCQGTVDSITTTEEGGDEDDTTAPVVSAVEASPNVLWPPNNKLVPVLVQATATDNTGVVAVDLTIADEYGELNQTVAMQSSGDGAYAAVVRLRAARDGKDKDGRVYTLTVRAIDAAGNVSAAVSTTVVVPHDQRR